MARRSLRPHLNQIRSWVRQGRTDAWIAHQLEVTVQQIEAFKKEHELLPDGEPNGAGPADFDDEIDLRAEDDAAIAAELEAEEARKAEEAARKAEEAAARRAAGGDEEEDEGEDGEERPRRRRGRRGGRGRARGASGSTEQLEGAFDHGEEGYGLWLDPAIADSPVYAEHWAGHRPVTVTVEADQIVIRRAGEPAGDDE
jgi:hypothetical protein